MQKYGNYLLILLTVFLISSCSTLPPPSTTHQPWSTRQQQVVQLQAWQLNGKIGVQTQHDAGSANVDWSQQGQQYQLALFGPLGAGQIKLSGHPGLVTLQAADGQRITAPSAQALLARHWGWNLPVNYLQYWVRGVPAPGVAAKYDLDASQHLQQLTQAGWTIRYQQYTTVHQIDLPTKLTISSPILTAKLVIYEWKNLQLPIDTLKRSKQNSAS